MTNLGNIHFQKRDMFNALTWYNKALERDPSNRTALLGAARANFELENYGSVRRAYAKLETVDAPLAARYSYLTSKDQDEGRASSAVLREAVVWEE